MEKYFYKNGVLAKTVEIVTSGMQQETMYDTLGNIIWRGNIVGNKRHGRFKIADQCFYFWYGKSIDESEYIEKSLIEGLAGLYE